MTSIMISYGDFRVELVEPEMVFDEGKLDAALNNLIGCAFENKFPGEILKCFEDTMTSDGPIVFPPTMKEMLKRLEDSNG